MKQRHHKDDFVDESQKKNLQTKITILFNNHSNEVFKEKNRFFSNHSEIQNDHCFGIKR